MYIFVPILHALMHIYHISYYTHDIYYIPMPLYTYATSQCPHTHTHTHTHTQTHTLYIIDLYYMHIYHISYNIYHISCIIYLYYMYQNFLHTTTYRHDTSTRA